MKIPFLQWLSPTDLSRVSQLQMLARGVVEGLSGGLHRSRHVGASIEFKEHRPYVRGDEIRSIDWKLFGKTDRLYIRQYEDETNLRCTIAIDESGSMRYCGSRANGLTKHEYAIRLAACISYMLVAQQDAVGVATFNKAIEKYIPPRNRPSHLQILLETLGASVPQAETDVGLSVQSLVQLCKRRGMVILISDCFGDADSILKSLALLRSNYQEVVVFQILDDDEVDFPFHNRTMFRSLEQRDAEQLVDPDQLRATYLKNLQEFQEAFRYGCAKNGVDLITARTSQSFSSLLSDYIARRRSIA